MVRRNKSLQNSSMDQVIQKVKGDHPLQNSRCFLLKSTLDGQDGQSIPKLQKDSPPLKIKRDHHLQILKMDDQLQEFRNALQNSMKNYPFEKIRRDHPLQTIRRDPILQKV